MAKVDNWLPLEFGLISTEVSSWGGFFVDGTSQVKVFDDHSWTQIEVTIDYSLKILIAET